jgi:histidyl-tRNA synthetase
MVDARTLKGFRDLLPEQAAARERAIETLRRVFRNAGFAPIDTPSLELTEVLAAKADDDSDSQKLMYRFIDHGGRDIGLRYDLTVPLARFVSQHRSEITYPFARYQIGTVWRAEKPQAGRYREFTQCDFDIVGSDTFESDFTVVSTAARAVQALVDQPAVLRINAVDCSPVSCAASTSPRTTTRQRSEHSTGSTRSAPAQSSTTCPP